MILPRFAMLLVALLALMPGPRVLAQGDGAGAASGTPAVQPVTSESFAGAFFVSKATHADGSQSTDVVGTMLLWTLLFLSMVSLGLIGYLAMANTRKTILPEGVAGEVKRLMGSGDYRQAIELTRKDESFFSKILHDGLQQSPQGLNAVVRALEQSADLNITARMRPVEILYMLGQISPMMGLLGTVYGIIFAFRVFVSMGGHASPALLAGGIGTALVATFWGLVVAIPALAGYSLLRNKIDLLTMQATAAAEELLTQFKPRATGGPAPGAPTAPPPPLPFVGAGPVAGPRPPASPRPNPGS